MTTISTAAAPMRLSAACASPGSAGATQTVADQVRGLWSGAWLWLAACHPDAEARLAALPKSGKVARLEASAGRRAARTVRGELPLSAFALRLREWTNAAADALAALDERKL